MRITATVRNEGTCHEAMVATAGATKTLPVPPKAGGPGSSVNGGEFLMLALATCFCNDVYREAARRSLHIACVEVEASADFEGVGLAAANVRYRARVSSPASLDQIEQLLHETDAVAEVHNTVRAAIPVQLLPWDQSGMRT